MKSQLISGRYCIDLMGGPVAPSELQFSSLDFGKIPIIVVLTKEDEMRDKIRKDLVTAGVAVTDEEVEARFDNVVVARRKEINGLLTWSYVPAANCKCLACSRMEITVYLTFILPHSDRIGEEYYRSHIPEP